MHMSINGWIYQQTVVHTKIRTLLSNENKYNTNKHNDTDWYQLCCIKNR